MPLQSNAVYHWHSPNHCRLYASGLEHVSKRSRFHFDGLVQERRNSSTLAIESRFSCTNFMFIQRILVIICDFFPKTSSDLTMLNGMHYTIITKKMHSTITTKKTIPLLDVEQKCLSNLNIDSKHLLVKETEKNLPHIFTQQKVVATATPQM